MGAGYAASCVLGVLLYEDVAYMRPAATLLWVLYTVDSLGCCFGITCMRSIPAKNVLYHHVPAILICTPVMYAENFGYEGWYNEFYQIVAAANVTSGNESMWVISSFFSKETLEGKPYKFLHSCITTCALAQYVVVAGAVCLSYRGEERPQVLLPMFAILTSIISTQIPLLVNVVTRLFYLLKN